MWLLVGRVWRGVDEVCLGLGCGEQGLEGVCERLLGVLAQGVVDAVVVRKEEELGEVGFGVSEPFGVVGPIACVGCGHSAASELYGPLTSGR